MSSDVFAIYQIDNSEKNREYRCRSYEYQIQHGFMITADNYGTGYSGTASRGMGAEAIRKKMESINPDKFKIRKFGVSDVIGLTAAGKTSFFYPPIRNLSVRFMQRILQNMKKPSTF